MLMDDYPDLFTLVQLHTSGDERIPWLNTRASFYGVTGTPTNWFDGVSDAVGAYPDAQSTYDWYLDKLGPDVPLHFSAFHPDYKMTDVPATPASTLRRARKIAMDKGLNYVYVGNVHDPEGDSTYCPSCGNA